MIMSVTHSPSLYQNITKKTFLTYMATLRNYENHDIAIAMSSSRADPVMG